MAACTQCLELAGRHKTVQPHSALKPMGKTNLGRASHGRATGFAHHFQCSVCSTKISCDRDDKDPDAGWYIVKEG